MEVTDHKVEQHQEKLAGVSLQELEALLALDQVRGFGPAAFRSATEERISPVELLEEPSALPLGGKRGDTLRRKIAALGHKERELAHDRAARQLARSAELSIRILTHRSREYPANLYSSNNPVPLLYAMGDLTVLKQRNVIACVGSRKTRPEYLRRLDRFSTLAVEGGWVIASGFANGADTAAHEAAIRAQGSTLLVMPSGLDIPFPPENRGLWKDWSHLNGVAMISEFPLGTKASALTLRKRNKTIVGVSRAVLVAQTALKGGTMNSYRFAVEQRKPIFTFPPDEKADTTGNRMILDERSSQVDLLADEQQQLQQIENWLALSSSI